MLISSLIRSFREKEIHKKRYILVKSNCIVSQLMLELTNTYDKNIHILLASQ